MDCLQTYPTLHYHKYHHDKIEWLCGGHHCVAHTSVPNCNAHPCSHACPNLTHKCCVDGYKCPIYSRICDYPIIHAHSPGNY